MQFIPMKNNHFAKYYYNDFKGNPTLLLFKLTLNCPYISSIKRKRPDFGAKLA